MNKRHREKKARRASQGYQEARERRERVFIEQVTRRAQGQADRLARDRYSIIGGKESTGGTT